MKYNTQYNNHPNTFFSYYVTHHRTTAENVTAKNHPIPKQQRDNQYCIPTAPTNTIQYSPSKNKHVK